MTKEDLKWHRHIDEAPQHEGYVLVAIKDYYGDYRYYVAIWEKPNSYYSNGAYHLEGCHTLVISQRLYWKYIEAPEENGNKSQSEER